MAEALADSQESIGLPEAQGSGHDHERAADQADRRKDTTHVLGPGAGTSRVEHRTKGREGTRRTDLNWRSHDRYEPRDPPRPPSAFYLLFDP